jgi:hypothetical protein
MDVVDVLADAFIMTVNVVDAPLELAVMLDTLSPRPDHA